jgi:3-deoxy-8-phosphooctulonate synthase
MNIHTIPQIKHSNSGNFFLLAGPCAIEGEEMAMRIAEKLVGITDKLEIPFVFKGSFKKANRSRIDSFSGIGDEKALQILRKVSETFGIPTVTDIHTNEDADKAAQYVDVLQIPAFLVRQTDLVVAAANTGKVVNLKKRTIYESGEYETRRSESVGLSQSKRIGYRQRNDVWLSRYDCRFSWNPYNATICHYRFGCNALFTTTKSNSWSYWRSTR